MSAITFWSLFNEKFFFYRKTSSKQTHRLCITKTCWTTDSEQTNTGNDEPYQELEERKKENLYQNLTLQ